MWCSVSAPSAFADNFRRHEKFQISTRHEEFKILRRNEEFGIFSRSDEEIKISPRRHCHIFLFHFRRRERATPAQQFRTAAFRSSQSRTRYTKSRCASVCRCSIQSRASARAAHGETEYSRASASQRIRSGRTARRIRRALQRPL